MKSAQIILLALILFSCSKVNDVSIQSAPESVLKGDSLQLISKVNGEGNPDSTLNWVIIDSVSKGTTIDKFGKLIIDREEKATSITVKAISVQDSSKFSSASIKIVLDLNYFLGNWAIKFVKNIGGEQRKTESGQRIWTLTKDSSVEKGSFVNTFYHTGYQEVVSTSSTIDISFTDLKWSDIKNEDIATKDEFPSGYLITGVDSEGGLQRENLFINNDYSKILRVGAEEELIFTRSKK